MLPDYSQDEFGQENSFKCHFDIGSQGNAWSNDFNLNGMNDCQLSPKDNQDFQEFYYGNSQNFDQNCSGKQQQQADSQMAFDFEGQGFSQNFDQNQFGQSFDGYGNDTTEPDHNFDCQMNFDREDCSQNFAEFQSPSDQGFDFDIETPGCVVHSGGQEGFDFLEGITEANSSKEYSMFGSDLKSTGPRMNKNFSEASFGMGTRHKT
jgi:hypothetical protein